MNVLEHALFTEIQHLIAPIYVEAAERVRDNPERVAEGREESRARLFIQ